jgi:hypothetical protein
MSGRHRDWQATRRYDTAESWTRTPFPATSCSLSTLNGSILAPMRALLRTLILLLVAAGCNEGTAPFVAEGEYVLQGVNDSPLPYTWTYPATSSSYIVRSQRISVMSGGTWTSSTSHVFAFPGMTRDETNALDGGTYTFDGSSGALVLGGTSPATVLVGSVSGRRLTITRGADRLVYER